MIYFIKRPSYKGPQKTRTYTWK